MAVNASTESSATPSHATATGARDAAGLSSDDRDLLRSRLTEDAARSREQAASLAESFEAIVEAAELVNTDDEHDPEGTTIAFERAQVSALHRQAEEDLAATDDALARLDDHDYGMCAGCTKPIGVERLVVLPASTLCVDCA